MEGGVGAFTEQLALAMGVGGHEVHVITSVRARPSDAPRNLSGSSEPFAQSFGWLHPRANRWRWPTLATVADIAVRYELEVLNLQYQAAAYNMNSPAINFLPRRLAPILPVVVTFHDLRVPYLLPKAGSLREKALIFMTRQASGSIATNAADQERLDGWSNRPLAQIPIGSNIETYHANHIEIAEIRDKLGLNEGDFLLGYFGFVSHAKGADTLIEALAQLDSRYHLVFIGGQAGDSDRANNEAFHQELEAAIASTGLASRVHWTGFLPSQRVSAHLGAADLMVIPYRDGVSLRRGTLMAVLAHGRPLLTTQGPEPPELFQQGEAMWLVAPDDPEALAAAVEELAGDPERRAALAAGAKTLGNSFGWDRIASDTVSFYEQVIAVSPPARNQNR